jgi:23S rRNA (guanine745-N1)-methyltransferase
VVDSGTGSGYYLAQVQSQRSDPVHALAVDASQAAVAMSVAATGSSGLVADVWRPSPIRSARADAVLCVFAPRNPAEFARVLRADATLVTVTPASDHLTELRAAGLLLGMQPDKLSKLDNSLDPHFDLAHRTALRYTVKLDADTASDLTSMGPSGHHEITREWPGGSVTVAVDVSTYKPKQPR